MRRLVLSLIAAAMAVPVATFLFRTYVKRADPTANSPQAAPIPASAAAALAAGVPLPKPGEPVIMHDASAVFQRAFWRRPGADIRVLDGERREWLDANSAVQKWQWFVAVQTSADFRAWLLERNPFELSKATTPIAASEISEAPAWWAPASKWSSFTTYRNGAEKLVVLLDPESGQLFATGQGAGFAAAAR
jgi:hypothetical protein